MNYNPAYHVTEKQFFKALSAIFMCDEKDNVIDFACEINKRLLDGNYSSADFFAFPTPLNKWGWRYETASLRNILYIPIDEEKGVVYTTDLEESINFRSTLGELFGDEYLIFKPKWLENALKLEKCVKRYYFEDCTEAPEDKEFFELIAKTPSEIYGEIYQQLFLDAEI